MHYRCPCSYSNAVSGKRGRGRGGCSTETTLNTWGQRRSCTSTNMVFSVEEKPFSLSSDPILCPVHRSCRTPWHSQQWRRPGLPSKSVSTPGAPRRRKISRHGHGRLEQLGNRRNRRKTITSISQAPLESGVLGHVFLSLAALLW